MLLKRHELVSHTWEISTFGKDFLFPFYSNNEEFGLLSYFATTLTKLKLMGKATLQKSGLDLALDPGVAKAS